MVVQIRWRPRDRVNKIHRIRISAGPVRVPSLFVMIASLVARDCTILVISVCGKVPH